MVRITIGRQDGERKWYDTFEVEEKPGMTVLEALFQVQERQDGSLCFRYSCRGAVCGSCAMLINRRPGLACRTQLSDVKGEVIEDSDKHRILLKKGPQDARKEEVLVEPLPNLTVIRDLVVDMEHFYRLVDSIKPWINIPDGKSPEENIIGPDLQMQIERYTNCILCSTCHGSCPAAARDGRYPGPAALAKAWRFYLDPRSNKEDLADLLSRVDSKEGIWGCDVVYNCVSVCPKKVPPTTAILKLRDILGKE
jgi:succinate dehydrogenase / fumarate reductase iron-sulfur subunit